MNRRDHSERGEALVLVLVFVIILGAALAVVLSTIAPGFQLTSATDVQSHMIYNGDAGIEWGINQLKANSGICTNALRSGANVTLPTDANVQQVQVTCQQTSSSGSNTFGSYAVVTGVNSHGQIYTNSGKACFSMSADPVGGGTPTFASTLANGSNSGIATCLSYPAAGTVPQWLVQETVPDTAANPAANTGLTGTFVLDGSDMWAVGKNTHSNTGRVWFSDDGEEWVDVTGSGACATTTTAGQLCGAAVTDVFAAVDPNNSALNDVWAVGTGGTGSSCTKGAIWYSTNTDTVSPTWSLQKCSSNATVFTDVTGFTTTSPASIVLWASGSNGNTAGYVCSYSNGSWCGSSTTLGGSTSTSGIFATPDSTNPTNTDVWVTGTSANKGAVWSSTDGGAHWSAATTFNGTSSLSDIDGADSTDVYATGASTAAGTPGVVVFWNGTAWSGLTTISTAKPLTGVFAADSTDIWLSGTDSGGHGALWWCDGSTGCASGSSTNSWTTSGQAVPSGTTALADVNGSDAQPGDIRAVGSSGTILTYAPSTSTTCSTSNECLAKVEGGPVFNGNLLNLASGLAVPDGNFDQFNGAAPNNPSSCNPVKTPDRLVVGDQPPSNPPAPDQPVYECKSSVPSSIQPKSAANPGGIDEPLPTAVPAAGTGPITVGVTGDASCPSFVVYTPGTYGKISWAKNTTYYFESGVYYFTGGFGAFDNGNTLPDNLYIIGGAPGQGDINTIAKSSPCWNHIQNQPGATNDNNTNYLTATQGTGVEWIVGAGSWMDVHTVNMELFTRQGGPASEGAQGVTIREVPPQCSAANGDFNPDSSLKYDTTVCFPSGSGWTTSFSGGPDQLFQVDANNHLPNVYVHGGLFLPDNNLEEFTNTSQVTLGPIFASSVEFTYESANVPPLLISAGSPNFAPTAVLTAKVTGAGPGTGLTYVVQSVVEVDLDPTTNAVTAVQQKGWQILNPPP